MPNYKRVELPSYTSGFTNTAIGLSAAYGLYRGLKAYTGKGQKTMFKRRFRRRRRFRPYRRRRYRRGYGGISRKRKLNAMINNLEHKTHDITITNAAIGNAGYLECLNILQAGTAVNQHEGDKICCTKLYGNFTLRGATAATKAHVVRITVVSDKQKMVNTKVSNGSPAIQFKATDAALFENVTDCTIAMFEKNTRKRFRILYDQKFVIGSSAANGDDVADLRTFKMNVKMPKNGKKLWYTGIALDEMNVTKNALYFVISSDTADADEKPSITGEMRMRFVDT